MRDIPPLWARQIVQEHHYSKDYGASASYLHGLLRAQDSGFSHIYGTAIWLPAVYAIRRYGCLPLQLSRLVVEPGMPTNSATFLMAHSMRLIDRKRWPVLLTYADSGQGHTGAIYKATGWEADGQGGGWNYYSPDGKQLSSLQGGNFIPCPDGWEARRTVKHRFVHRAIAASSDAPTIQVGEGSSQLTLSLQLQEVGDVSNVDREIAEAARLHGILLDNERMIRGDEPVALASLCYTDSASRSVHHDQGTEPLVPSGSGGSVLPEPRRSQGSDTTAACCADSPDAYRLRWEATRDAGKAEPGQPSQEVGS